MIRVLMLVLGMAPLFAAAQPDQLDLRANRQRLSEVLESIAKQCDAGLIVSKSVQGRLNGEVTLTARKASWADASRWLADDFHMTMHLMGEHLEIGDADREFRARLVSVTYDIRTLTKPLSAFPGPDLDIPEIGGVGSRLLPPIEPESVPQINEFIELVQKHVAPITWQIDGVGIKEFNGTMVVIQVPEVHQRIAEFIATLERTSARQVIVRCHRLPAGAPQSTVLDAATWAPIAKGLTAPIGVVQLLDEQTNGHFSGTQRAIISDTDNNQDVFDPIVSVISDGLSVDLDVHVTNAGVVTTTRFGVTAKQVITPTAITSPNGKILTPIELVASDHGYTRDTRVIPDGGAAIYHVGDQAYAVSVEVLDFTKRP
ncbi:MAG TPA: hypothetical protein VHX44_14030 [Planctomycetota bacterium]|jgi:hypothetical protein|nr:hypothetical protein [Planctomycetota bacterium]